MKKLHIKELLEGTKFTQEEFEAVLESLPDEIDGKPHKANVRKYFKKNGTAKVKKQEGQEWHDTQGFIRRQISRQIHMNRLRKHRDAHKQLIKKKRTRTHKVRRYGKIERVREDRPAAAEQIESEPADLEALRNELVKKYNRIVRISDPTDSEKELAEVIYAQIGKIEKELEPNENIA